MVKVKFLASHFLRNIFEGQVSLYTVELQVNGSFVKACVILFYLIFLVSCAQVDRVLDFQLLDMLRQSIAAIFIFPLYVAALGSLLVARYFDRLKSNENTVMLLVGTYMTIAFTYIVYPFTVWTLSNQIYTVATSEKTASAYVILTASIVFIATGAVLNFGTLVVRNTVWNKFSLSCVTPWAEIISYFCMVMIQIAAPCLKIQNTRALQVAFYVFSDLVLALNFYNLLRILPFWNVNMSAFYIQPYASVLIIKIFLEICPDALNKTMMGLICLGLAKLIFRLIPNLVFYQAKMCIFSKSKDTFSTYIGMTRMLSYLNLNPQDVESSESDLFTYYIGQWQGFADSVNTRDETVCQRKQLIEYLINQNSNDVWNLRMLLSLIAADPLAWLSYAYSTLARLKTALPKTFLGDFLYYHNKRLLEIKLDAIYKGKIKEDPESPNTVPYLYKNFAVDYRSKQDDQSDSVDISKVFYWIDLHLVIVKTATCMIDKLSTIFNSLSTGENLSTSNLYDLNRDTMNIDKKMLKLINKTTLDDDSLPSYIYPTIIFYLSLVRNRIRKAERIYTNYKMKLQHLQAAYEKYNSLLGAFDEKTKSMINTVSLVVSLDQSRLGEIQHASLDHAAFLGYPENGEIIGKNIHDFFPRSMVAHHRVIMCSDRVPGVMNVATPIFLNGFDGLLRSGTVDIRLNRSMDQGVQSILLLRFLKASENTAQLLTDHEGKILSANHDFWYKMASMVKLEPTSLDQISPTLASSLQLLLTGDEVKQIKAERGMPEIIYAIQDGIAELVERNRAGDMIYNVEKESPWEKSFAERSFRAKVETYRSFGTPLCRITIWFGDLTSSKLELERSNGAAIIDAHANKRSSFQMQNHLDSYEDYENGVKQHKTKSVGTRFKDVFRFFFKAYTRMTAEEIKMIENQENSIIPTAFRLMKECSELVSRMYTINSNNVDYQTMSPSQSKNKITTFKPPLEKPENRKLLETNIDNEDAADMQTPFMLKTGHVFKPYQQLKTEVAEKISKCMTPKVNQQKGIFDKTMADFIKNNGINNESMRGNRQEYKISRNDRDESISQQQVLKRVKNILEKVDKDEKYYMKRQTMASEGSLNSNAVTNKKIYLKSIDDIQDTTSLKKEHMYPLILSVTYIMVSFIALFGIGSIIRQYCAVNLKLYTLNNNLIHIDAAIRKSIVPMEAGFTTSSNIAVYDLYGDGIGGFGDDYLKYLQKTSYDNEYRALEGVDHFEYLLKMYESFGPTILQNLKSYMNDDSVSNIDTSYLSYLTQTKAGLNIYQQAFLEPQFTNNVSLEAFLMSVEVQLKVVTEKYKYPMQYYSDKSPPILATPEDKARLLNAYETPLILAKNLATGILPDLMAQTSKLAQLTTETLVADYSSKLTVTFSTAFVLGFVVLVLAIVAAVMMAVKLSDALKVYADLRPREVALQIMNIRDCGRIIREESMNEELIVDKYLRHKKHNLNDQIKLNKGIQQRKVLIIIKKGELKNKLFFSSSILIVLLYFLITATFFALVGAMIVQKHKVDETIQIERFMFTAYSKLVNVNRNHLNLHLLVVYGNYLKPDNAYPEDIDLMSSIDDLVHYFVEMKTNFAEYFSARDAVRLKEMIFDDCCEYLSPKFVWYDLHYKVCNRLPATKQGLIGFLYYERELLGDLKTKALNDTAFLNRTKTVIEISPIVNEYMSETYIRYRMARHSIMESMVDLLFEVNDSTMNSRLDQIVNMVNNISSAIVIFVTLASTLASLIAFISYRREFTICLQTFRNIDADLLQHHPTLKRSFLGYFRSRL